MRKLFFISFGLIILFSSCKNELVLNAEWKDITIVYGLLNPKDSVHYIKINKAFLGEGNVLFMAQNPDSSNYNNELEVKVEEWKNGQYNNKTMYFDTTTVYNKDSGTFYYPKQIIYKSNVRLDSSDNNIEYKLKITNKNTGKIISGHTKLIEKFYINKPNPNVIKPTVDFSRNSPVTVEFTTSGNAMYYTVYFRFYYFEQDTVSLVASNKYLDLFVAEAVYDYTSTKISMYCQGSDFYSMLKSKIPYNPNMIRKIRMGKEIELIIYAADYELYTYMQAYKIANGINQNFLEYTNIENGFGVFASRYYLKGSYNLSNASLDSLYDGSYTKNLGFIK